MDTFYERLQGKCSEHSLSVTGLCKKLGIPSSHTGHWKKGGRPGVKILELLANELECSAGYLLLGDEIKKSPAEAGAREAGYSDEILAIADDFMSLSEDRRQVVKDLVASLRHQQGL